MNRLLSSVISLLACMASLSAAAGNLPALELKGLRIGMESAEVKAANPQASCEPMGPALERCTDEKAALNDRKALLELYFMDGKLLSASYQRLLTLHAQEIGELLTQKFGAPTFQQMETTWHLGADRDVRRPKSIWDRDGVQLQVLPFALHDKRADNTFSTVRLIDAVTWDEQWLPRYRAAQAEPTTKRDLTKADI